MKKLFFLFITAVLFLTVSTKQAHGYATPAIDPLRPPLWTASAILQKRAVLAQFPLQSGLAQGYNYLDNHTSEIARWQEQFYDYLHSFGDVLQMAAGFYSVYWEVVQVKKNLDEVKNAIRICPTGVFATAMYSDGRKNIYERLTKNIIHMTNTVYDIIRSNGSQKDRIDELRTFVGELQVFNSEIRELAYKIRYTSFVDLWDMITCKIKTQVREDRGIIALDCMKDAAMRMKEKTYTWNLN